MNQAQRNYLVEQIEKTAKEKRKLLESLIPEYPNLNNYLTHAVMSDKFEVRTQDEIMETLRQKVLGLKNGDTLLGDRWSSNGRTIELKASDIFVIPDEFRRLHDEYTKKKDEINKKLSELDAEVKTLVMRVKLSSNSTL